MRNPFCINCRLPQRMHTTDKLFSLLSDTPALYLRPNARYDCLRALFGAGQASPLAFLFLTTLGVSSLLLASTCTSADCDTPTKMSQRADILGDPLPQCTMFTDLFVGLFYIQNYTGSIWTLEEISANHQSEAKIDDRKPDQVFTILSILNRQLGPDREISLDSADCHIGAS